MPSLIELETNIKGTHAAQITDEVVTAQLDTPVPLQHNPLVAGPVAARSMSGATDYTQSDSPLTGDYVVDYVNGTFSANGTGAITEGQPVSVSYEYDPYQEVVGLALAELSAALARPREYLFNLVAGQTEYDLPPDFLYAIKLICSGTIAGSHPAYSWVCYAGSCNPYEFRLGQLVLTEVPGSASDCCLTYAAGILPDENGDVDLLPNADTALLYKAHALACLMPTGRTINSTAQLGAGLSKYALSMGDEKIDKSWAVTSTANRLTLAKELNSAYDNLVKRLRIYGTRSRGTDYYKGLPNAYVIR